MCRRLRRRNNFCRRRREESYSKFFSQSLVTSTPTKNWLIASKRLHCRRQIKIFFRILALFVFVLLFLFSLPRFIAYQGRREVPEMTQEKAQKFLESAGGVDAINLEAKNLFARLWINPKHFIDAKYLTDFSAISNLCLECGNYPGNKNHRVTVFFDSQDGRHIEIVFGNHWSLKRIYIFDANAAANLNSSHQWLQMASNIFVSK